MHQLLEVDMIYTGIKSVISFQFVCDCDWTVGYLKGEFLIIIVIRG